MDIRSLEICFGLCDLIESGLCRSILITAGRRRIAIVRIASVFCLSVALVNVFLMANILLLEKQQQQQGLFQVMLANRNSNEGGQLQLPLQPSSLLRSRARVISKNTHMTNLTSSFSTTNWKSSPHLVDCHQVLKSLQEDKGNQEQEVQDTGMFMPIHCPSKICQQHSQILMNIHNPLSDTVSYKIYKEGCFECDHLTKLLDALSHYPTSYLLDIGGNIGMWTLAAAAGGHETFTIEPFVLNYRRICKSVDKNDFYDKVHLMNVAATSQNTTFRIDVPKKNKGGGRVAVVSSSSSMKDFHDEFIVKGVPIDTLHLPTDRPIVMKLDVEGHEFEALLGGINFLQRANIVYAMTELRPTFQKDAQTYSSWKRIVGILASKGLQPYRIDYKNETLLDVSRLHEWRHVKHPQVRYFDVLWRKKEG